MHYIHTYMIKSSESSRENKVIDILDTGDSNGGNYSQEFAISKFNSATLVHIKSLYQVFHLGKCFMGLSWSLGHLVVRSHSSKSREHPRQLPDIYGAISESTRNGNTFQSCNGHEASPSSNTSFNTCLCRMLKTQLWKTPESCLLIPLVPSFVSVLS